MFTRTPLFYSTWAVIVGAVYTVCELTFLHPNNNAWMLVPGFTLITFIINLLNRDEEKRLRAQKANVKRDQQ